MAVIPVQVSRRPLETGGVVQFPTSDPVAAATAQAGAKLADVAGDLAATYKAQTVRRERFAAMQDWDAFSSEMDAELINAGREAKPGAIGLHDKVYEDFDKKASERIAGLPQHLRPEFEARKQSALAAYSNRAAKVERAESDRFQLEGINKRLGQAKQGILQLGPDGIEAYKRDVDELIDSSTLPVVEREAQRKRTDEELKKTGFAELHRRDPAAAQAVVAQWKGTSVVDRIIGVESGGDANAKNPNSTATGAGQFIESTWVDTIKRHRPELAQGRDRDALLALRNDPKLSREMTARLAEDNAARLRTSDIPTTPANIYLAHFLGPADAIKVLSVSGDNKISGLISQKSIDANKSILQGKTVGEVVAWAQKKMGDGGPVAPGGIGAGGDTRFSGLPYETMVELISGADKDRASRQSQLDAATTKQQKEASDTLMKEAFSRVAKNELTADFVEAARPYVSPTEYNNLLKAMGEDAPSNDPDAMVDLVRKIDTTSSDEFQKVAGEYLANKKIKVETYVQLSEKNRAASRDDQPASPYKSGRSLVNTTLDPGQLLSGPAAAIGRANQAQALIEFDNWAGANPRADRAESTAQAQEIIKRYQVIPYDQMKLAVGTSTYFGNKSRSQIAAPDVEQAEVRLFQDIQSGKLTREQQSFEIRLLQSWREIIAKEEAAKGAAGGPKR